MRIAITGIGVVSAIGNCVEETLSSLREERGGIRRVVLDGMGVQLVGDVRMGNDLLSDLLDIHCEVPRSVLLGVKAAREALGNAGICGGDVAFVNGTTVGGMDYTERHYGGDAERYKTMHTAGVCSELIAKNIEARGEVVTISTACSSALNSIIMACNMIRAGKTNRVLAGGTECLTEFHQRGFMSLGIVDSELCRPFDAERNGLNLGEGAAYLVLEREDEAKARGAEILGYVAGYGNACDAYHQTATTEDGEGAYLAMRKAIEMAGIEVERVDYINAHGTATQDNDISESAAIRRVFGEGYPMVSSTKGFTGHTTSACGAIESVFSLLAMRYGFVPANLNWGEAVEGMIVPVGHTVERTMRYVMCNAFGFGGNDSSVILSDMPEGELEVIDNVTVMERNCVEKSEDDDYGQWIKPMEARRMTRQMRVVVAAACEALESAGLERPDAIITTTHLGLIVNSLKILDAMKAGEEVKPSLFMLSTHNSISSMLAIRFGCRGYNSTYCSSWGAVEDASMVISLGDARNVMVVDYEENEGIWEYDAKAKVRIITRQ